MDIHLSVVIPAFNERSVLPGTLWHLRRYLDKQPYAAELIVVDDGSTDGSSELLNRFSREFPALRVLRNEPNQGKGASVRRGFLASLGQYVVFVDADLPAEPEDLAALLAPLHRGKAIAIASRAGSEGDAAASPLRLVASKLYRSSVRSILGLPMRDTQFGFKAFARESVLPIFQDARQYGYSLDVELLFAAWQHGLSVEEVSIPMVERRAETGYAILFSAPRMLLDLFRISFGAAADVRTVLGRCAAFLLGFSVDLGTGPRAQSSRLP